MNMTKIITRILLAVLIVGGVAFWNLMPTSWIDRLPAFWRIGIVTCAVIFSVFTLIGYVIDSGIPRRFFQKK